MKIVKISYSGQRQSGVALIEFALIALFVLFPLLLAIMEFGRVFYLWNTVQEVTRHAAREAVVRDFGITEMSQIQRGAVFQAETSTGTVGVPAATGVVTNLNVKITYLKANGVDEVNPYPDDPADNISACGDATRQDSCIRFVRAEVCTGNPCTAVTYIPMMGLFSFLGVNIPVSAVVMPAESLGFTISS